jgi:hypothetical protein
LKCPPDSALDLLITTELIKLFRHVQHVLELGACTDDVACQSINGAEAINAVVQKCLSLRATFVEQKPQLRRVVLHVTYATGKPYTSHGTDAVHISTCARLRSNVLQG